MGELFGPGDKAPVSGQYEIVGPKGGRLDGKEITMIKRNTFPPIPGGKRYRLVDKTKH